MTLQRRLVAVMSILLVVGLLVADIVTYVSVRSFLYGRADETLTSSEGLAFNYVAFATLHKTPLSASDLSRHVSPDVYVLIVNAKGKVVVRRPSGSPARPNPQPLVSSAVPVQLVPAVTSHTFGRYAGTFHPDPNAVIVGSKGDPDGQYRTVAVNVPQGTMYVALSLNPTNDTLASLRRVEILASIAVLLVMGFLALWLVRRDLRPLREMAQTADAIASGDLSRRVPQETPTTEVGRLGTALNEMLTQIESAFAEKTASEDRLRQFVADASHELRTPLTSIRGYAELLRRGGFSDEAGTRKALQRVEDEAKRMGGLVEDLLLLAELDRGRPLRAEPVGLHRICADVVDDNNAFNHEHITHDGVGERGRRARRPRAPDPGRPQPRAQRADPHASRHECPCFGARRTRHGCAPGHRQRPGHGPDHRRPRLRSLLPPGPRPFGTGHWVGLGHREGHRRRTGRYGGGRKGRARPGRHRTGAHPACAHLGPIGDPAGSLPTAGALTLRVPGTPAPTRT